MGAGEVMAKIGELLPDALRALGAVAELARRSGATDEQIREAVRAKALAEMDRIDAQQAADEQAEFAKFPGDGA